MQNIYDDPDFFAGYAELRRTESGLNAALEQPALMSLLPPSLDGLDVLDLGCGFGDFAAAAKAKGAASVAGIDISERMLDIARGRVTDPTVSFLRAPIETAELSEESFDLIVSSLALHYVEDYAGVVAKIARALRPYGHIVFSVEHPVMTANGDYEWQCDAAGAKLHWKLDRYREEGRRESTWFVDGVVKYHRTVETYVNGLIDAGLTLKRLIEPEATPDAMKTRADLIETRRRPVFLLLAAEKA
jgi:ubiquinone/menaquinone biosynthesis C-methylase UbiE